MTSTPIIGAHLSTAGGLGNAVARAREIGAAALQVFPGNPRSYRPARRHPDEMREFSEELRSAAMPLYIHSVYVLNLASPDAEVHDRSITALAAALRLGALTGAAGVVTHIGSHKGAGFETGAENVCRAVERAVDLASEVHADLLPGDAGAVARAMPPLLLEAGAGGGNFVGKTPRELGALLRALPDGTGICLDSAHLFAAGFPVHTDDGLGRFLDDVDRHAGLEHLRLLHLNDSRTELGSKHDRHANLGEGVLGIDGLRPFFAAPALAGIPFILEVPGADGSGPDAENVRAAHSLAATVAKE